MFFVWPETAFSVGENIKHGVNRNMTGTLQIGQVLEKVRGA
jgi:hypothetical protein